MRRARLGTAVPASEERVLTIERDRADGALDGIVVDLDPAVLKEEAEACPAGQRIAIASASLVFWLTTSRAAEVGRIIRMIPRMPMPP
jgi:hypothetical protein